MYCCKRSPGGVEVRFKELSPALTVPSLLPLVSTGEWSASKGGDRVPLLTSYGAASGGELEGEECRMGDSGLPVCSSSLNGSAIAFGGGGGDDDGVVWPVPLSVDEGKV